MNHAVKNGVIYGLVSVVFTLVLYLIDKTLLSKFMMLTLVGFAIMIFFMVKSAREEKMDNEGILPYGEAVKNTFVVVAIGMLISSLFTFILYNFIDPSLIDMLKDATIETTRSMMEKFGAPEDQIDQAMEQIEDTDMDMSMSKVLVQYAQSLIFGLIISLIVSAFVKKNPSIA